MESLLNFLQWRRLRWCKMTQPTKTFHNPEGSTPGALIKTPLQRGVWGRQVLRNRFNGFSHAVETVETVSQASRTSLTPLKRCVNRIRQRRRYGWYNVTGLGLRLLIASLALGLALLGAGAASEMVPFPRRIGAITNGAAATAHPVVKTNRAKPLPRGAATKTNANAKTNAVAAPAPPGAAHTKSHLLEMVHRWQSNPSFYPAAGIAVCLLGLLAFRFLKLKPKPAQGTSALPSKFSGKVPSRATASAIRSCNVLEVGPQARRLWHFDAHGSKYVLGREQTCVEAERLPSKVVAKDWRTLFQRKLNIAWLPPEHVFLRVVQLPRSDFNETLSMVELQLEKLSPMPVAQIVWSLHVLPHTSGNMQTVIVSVVARNIVEEFLGKLEGQGYMADRLELPLLDQLQTTAITEDGAWIYPEAAGGKDSALVAWWYGGVLQNLDFLTLPAANRPAALKEQLMQMTWAGELEGWLTSPPGWHLVADVGATEWEPALRAGLEQPIDTLTPMASMDLAALTARRSAQAEPRANLLPEEYSLRYQQQFVDRLWLRGLFVVAAIYLLYVAVFMARLAYATYLTDAVESQVALLGPTYTNAIQLRDKFKVLKERQDLKYAALDCWNTTARLLPAEVTLDSLNFNQGSRLSLSGTAPAGQIRSLLEFEAAMRRATVDGQPLFDPNRGDSLQYRDQGSIAAWSLRLELKRAEAQ